MEKDALVNSYEKKILNLQDEYKKVKLYLQREIKIISESYDNYLESLIGILHTESITLHDMMIKADKDKEEFLYLQSIIQVLFAYVGYLSIIYAYKLCRLSIIYLYLQTGIYIIKLKQLLKSNSSFSHILIII
jgi:hypothetical protein